MEVNLAWQTRDGHLNKFQGGTYNYNYDYNYIKEKIGSILDKRPLNIPKKKIDQF